jgi:hypothetical protein
MSVQCPEKLGSDRVLDLEGFARDRLGGVSHWKRQLFGFVVLLVADLACGSTTTTDSGDGATSSEGGPDAVSTGVDAVSSDADGVSCADLAARAAALLVKDCMSSDECAVTTVYSCCTVYTGIRSDHKAAFELAQSDHDRACPDLRGCQCQDHTETNELVPPQQPPLPVSATCDLNKCTAHQK